MYSHFLDALVHFQLRAPNPAQNRTAAGVRPAAWATGDTRVAQTLLSRRRICPADTFVPQTHLSRIHIYPRTPLSRGRRRTRVPPE